MNLSAVVTCPNCEMRVLPKADGTCPSCRSIIPQKENGSISKSVESIVSSIGTTSSKQQSSSTTKVDDKRTISRGSASKKLKEETKRKPALVPGLSNPRAISPKIRWEIIVGIFGFLLIVVVILFNVFWNHTSAKQAATISATPWKLTPPPISTSTPDIPTILSAMSIVVSGQGVPSAAVYNPNEPGPHPMVLLTTSGTAYNDWNEKLPYDWPPSSVGNTELVVLIGAEREYKIGSQLYYCGYYIPLYRYEVDMELREARTGRTLATSTFIGSSPSAPGRVSCDTTRLEGSHFVYANLEEWLCQTVNLQGCWMPLHTLDGDPGSAEIMAFSPDGQTLALGAADNATVRLLRVADGTLLRILDLEYEGPVFSLAFSPDGQTLASGTAGGILKLWQVSDGILLHTLELGWGVGIVYNLAFSPDGQNLASVTADDIMRLWQVSDGTLLHEYPGSYHPKNLG